jgi:hypothetical protein
MKRDGVWAEDIFILCAASFLKRDIYITSAQQNERHPWLIFKSPTQTAWKFPITMAMIPHQHFQSIEKQTLDTHGEYWCLGCGQHKQGSLLRHLGHAHACKRFYNYSVLLTEKKRIQKNRKPHHKMNTDEEIQFFINYLNLPYEIKKLEETDTSQSSYFKTLYSWLNNENQCTYLSPKALKETIYDCISHLYESQNETFMQYYNTSSLQGTEIGINNVKDVIFKPENIKLTRAVFRSKLGKHIT